MTLDWREREKKEREIKNKISSLRPEELEFIDSKISEHLKNRLRRWAANRWWRLFGSQGHSLATLEDESRFIESLDKVFTFPAPSHLIAQPSHARQEYTTKETTKRGVFQTITFYGPPVGRLLELMLYGFFEFNGKWIFINRSGQLPNGEKAPDQWHVLSEGTQPSDRLGVRITVAIRNCQGRKHHYPPPSAVFSSLPTTAKEHFADGFKAPLAHEDWLGWLANEVCHHPFDSTPTTVDLAGDYLLDSHPLMDLIANGKRISGTRVEPVNGNYFDCRPDNLASRSSRGRKMKCNSCRKPTTAKESDRVKDSTGSTFRICRACQAWAGRQRS